MLLHRNIFFLAIGIIVVSAAFTARAIWWLRSEKAQGVFAFNGGGNALEQIRSSQSFNYYMHGKDSIWFNGINLGDLPEKSVIPIRYNPSDVYDAKVDTFMGVWGGPIVYGCLPLLVLLVLALHPKIIPYNAHIRLNRKKPVIEIVPAYHHPFTDLP